VNSFPILQRYNPERSPSQFWNDAPIAYPAIPLGLTPYRFRHNSFAPPPLDVGTLAKHLLFKVSRGLHEHEDYREVHQKKQTEGQAMPPLRSQNPATTATLAPAAIPFYKRSYRNADTNGVSAPGPRVVGADLVPARCRQCRRGGQARGLPLRPGGQLPLRRGHPRGVAPCRRDTSGKCYRV
jgi:hypothetical protein